MGFFETFLGLRHPKDGNELVGIWERRDDQFSGCVVRVEREVNELVGKIIVSTQKMLTAGWNVGDRKWRLIEANSQGLWQLMDLRKQYDTQSKKVLSIDYAHYWISLGDHGKKICLHQSRVPIFAAQKWSKIG